MGVAAGDMDRDGDLDLATTNLGANRVFATSSYGALTDVAPELGLTLSHLPEGAHPRVSSWGVSWADLDNDGWLELLVQNGHLLGHPDLANAADTPAAMFVRQRDGRYIDMAPQAGLARQHVVGRAIATADLDGDGDLDVLQTAVNGTAAVFANHSDSDSAWISVDLVGTRDNRDGLGARLTVTADTVRHVRELTPHHGYGSTSSKRLHVGLGPNVDAVDIEVRWPSGQVSTQTAVPVDQRIQVVQP